MLLSIIVSTTSTAAAAIYKAVADYTIESGAIFRTQHDEIIVPAIHQWWTNGGKERTAATVNFLLQVLMVVALIVAAAIVSTVYIAYRAAKLAWNNREEIVQTEAARWVNITQALTHYWVMVNNRVADEATALLSAAMGIAIAIS